jgi:hypothetical protein
LAAVAAVDVEDLITVGLDLDLDLGRLLDRLLADVPHVLEGSLLPVQ